MEIASIASGGSTPCGRGWRLDDEDQGQEFDLGQVGSNSAAGQPLCRVIQPSSTQTAGLGSTSQTGSWPPINRQMTPQQDDVVDNISVAVLPSDRLLPIGEVTFQLDAIDGSEETGLTGELLRYLVDTGLVQPCKLITSATVSKASSCSSSGAERNRKRGVRAAAMARVKCDPGDVDTGVEDAPRLNHVTDGTHAAKQPPFSSSSSSPSGPVSQPAPSSAAGLPPHSHTSTKSVDIDCIPDAGHYPFRYHGLNCTLHVMLGTEVHCLAQTKLVRKMEVGITLASDQQDAKDVLTILMQEAHQYVDNMNHDQRKTVKIASLRRDFWSTITYRPKRDLSTVYLPGQVKERVRSEVATFLGDKDEYERFGIPYRRTFLLAGPPGTGKTSLILAIASHFDKPIYLLQVSPKTDDQALVSVLQDVRDHEGAFIVIEDVDTLFASSPGSAASSRSHAPGSAAQSLSFSGLLNALDGLASPTGLVIFLTTNHVDRLDHAFLRPGRVDSIVQFDYLIHNKEQVADIWRSLVPQCGQGQFDAFMAKMQASQACAKLTPAVLQKFLFDHRRDADLLASFPEMEELARFMLQRLQDIEGRADSYTV